MSPALRSTLLACSIALGACHQCGSDKPSPVVYSDASASASSAPAATTPADASLDASPVDAGDASLPPDAALSTDQRKAYGAAMTEGRGLVAAKKYAPAVDAFTRALAAAPDDPHALAERGHAHLLANDPSAASGDLLAAEASADPGDKKLLAQIELDWAAADDALADTAKAPELRGAATGHYRRSNELSANGKAAAHANGCPASWGTLETTTYAHPTEASVKLGHPEIPWARLADGVFARSRRDTNKTEVLLPIDGARFALVITNATGPWTCGKLGDLDVSNRAGTWRVEVQAHAGGAASGACSCDGEPCAGACTCKEPFCPLDCKGTEQPAGEHQELYVDAKTGAGVWQVRVDHAFLSELTLDVDLATHRFHATGLGCIADLPLSH